MKKDPIAVLEVGTSRTVVCVGEPDDNGNIRLTGMGSFPTNGVRKGQIIDFKKVANGVEAARVQAEDESEINIWQVHLAVAGAHITAQPHMERVAIQAVDKIVSSDDIEELDDILSEPVLDAERVLLHTLNQYWDVDDQNGIANPEGMRCNMLSRNALVVSGLQNRVDNFKQVVADLKMDVVDVVFDGVAASRAVLSTAQKRDGVVLIDLGAGTTSVMVFQNQVVTELFCLGVGGDHVTYDIACGFNINWAKAEEIKCKFGRATLDAQSAQERIKIPGRETFGPDSINAKSLQVIINARMDEIFKITKDRLQEAGLMFNLGAGLVLTGGGAALTDIESLAQRVFNLPCHKGKILNVDGFSEYGDPESYATVAGLLRYAYDALETKKNSRGIWGRFSEKFLGK